MTNSNLKVEMADNRTLSLEPYLTLARDLADLLASRRPSPQFRAELRRSLMASARRQQAQFLLDLPSPATSPNVHLSGLMADWIHAAGQPAHRWAVGAAAVSLAGILVYVLRHRGRPAASA